MTFLVVIAIFIVIRLVIGIQLYRTGRRNNLPNLYWLSGVFFVNFILLFFVDFGDNPLGKLPFSYFIVSASPIIINALLIQFIRTTFYNNKANPHRWFWMLYIVFSLMGIYGLIQGGSFDKPSPWLIGFYLSGLVVWGWHTSVAFTAYRSIQADEHVENWVKARYRLIIAYGLIECIGSVLASARILLAGSPEISLDVLQGILALCNLSTIALQTVVWLAPQALEYIFDRQKRAHLDYEEKHFSALRVFGTAMAEGTSLKNMACFYAIRATVEKSKGVHDANALRSEIDTMSYKEWENVLRHSELRRILMNSGADKTSVDHAIGNALSALVEKQSLLTFRAH